MLKQDLRYKVTTHLRFDVINEEEELNLNRAELVTENKDEAVRHGDGAEVVVGLAVRELLFCVLPCREAGRCLTIEVPQQPLCGYLAHEKVPPPRATVWP